MLTKAFILVCALAAVLAYPSADEYRPVEYQRARREAPTRAPTPPPYQSPLQLRGGGGGSPQGGYDISIDGRAPVWKSDNGNHQLDVTGGYSQHLGGPWGNSRPDYRVGAGYTYRF